MSKSEDKLVFFEDDCVCENVEYMLNTTKYTTKNN